jgi:hypothetical protein
VITGFSGLRVPDREIGWLWWLGGRSIRKGRRSGFLSNAGSLQAFWMCGLDCLNMVGKLCSGVGDYESQSCHRHESAATRFNLCAVLAP